MKEVWAPCKVWNYFQQTSHLPPAEIMASKYFAWSELLVNQTDIEKAVYLENILKQALRADIYKMKLFGGRPVRITSGLRSKKYNAELKKRGYNSSPTSKHMTGEALDFVVKGLTPLQVYSLLDAVHEGELEKALTWTHMADFPKPKRIDENYNLINCNFNSEKLKKLLVA